jgi:hypothetical protein
MSVDTITTESVQGIAGTEKAPTWMIAAVRVAAAIVAAVPLLTAALYLVGSIGYSQYLHILALPEGYFPATFEQTLVNGYFVIFRAIASFPNDRYDPYFVLAFGVLVLMLAVVNFGPRGKSTPRPKFLVRRPNFKRALEALAISTLFASGLMVVSTVASLVLLAAPLLGARGGEGWAQDVLDNSRSACDVGGRCITFRNGDEETSGRLVASSATHVALLMADRRSVVIVNLEGVPVATSVVRN